ncbi:MAG: hypothetical protein ACI4PR_02645 [Acutalibacteraceae bacterium]
MDKKEIKNELENVSGGEDQEGGNKAPKKKKSTILTLGYMILHPIEATKRIKDIINAGPLLKYGGPLVKYGGPGMVSPKRKSEDNNEPMDPPKPE